MLSSGLKGSNTTVSEETQDNHNLNEPDDAGEPVVYAVGKTDRGWCFCGREFLATAGLATTTAAAAGCVGNLRRPTATAVPTAPPVATPPVPTPTAIATEAPTPSPALSPDEKTVGCFTLLAHSEMVNSVTISPDGKLLASGSDDNTVKLWSLPDGQLLKTLSDHANVVGPRRSARTAHCWRLQTEVRRFRCGRCPRVRC